MYLHQYGCHSPGGWAPFGAPSHPLLAPPYLPKMVSAYFWIFKLFFTSNNRPPHSPLNSHLRPWHSKETVPIIISNQCASAICSSFSLTSNTRVYLTLEHVGLAKGPGSWDGHTDMVPRTSLLDV